MAFDPLSSQGVLKALLSGERAAQAILATRAGDESAFHEYGAFLERNFRIYLEARLQSYRAEQRWPELPFWHRRHQAPTEYGSIPLDLSWSPSSKPSLNNGAQQGM